MKETSQDGYQLTSENMDGADPAGIVESNNDARRTKRVRKPKPKPYSPEGPQTKGIKRSVKDIKSADENESEAGEEVKVKRQYRKKINYGELTENDDSTSDEKPVKRKKKFKEQDEDYVIADTNKQKRPKKVKDESVPKVVRRRKKKDRADEVIECDSGADCAAMPNLSPAITEGIEVFKTTGTLASGENSFLLSRPLSPNIIVSPPNLTPIKVTTPIDDSGKSPPCAPKDSVTSPKSSEKRPSSAKKRTKLSLKNFRNRTSVQTRLSFDKKISTSKLRKVPCIASMRNLGGNFFSELAYSSDL